MQKIYLYFFVIFSFFHFSYSQTDPTLAVGLETLTYQKGAIDVEVLKEIILEKQNELKTEGLKRFMFNLFPEGNYTTKFYLQNAIHILLNEENPKVVEKELLEILTNYSLALGFTIAHKELWGQELTIKYSNEFNNKILFGKYKNNLYRSTKKAIKLQKSIDTLKAKLNAVTTPNLPNINDDSELFENFKTYRSQIKKKEKIEQLVSQKTNKLEKFKSRKKTLSYTDFKRNDTIPFWLSLDIMATILSENELLVKKGFFKQKINFKESIEYRNWHKNDPIIIRQIDTIIKNISKNSVALINNFGVIKELIAKKGHSLEGLSRLYMKELKSNSSINSLIDSLPSFEAKETFKIITRKIEKGQDLIELIKIASPNIDSLVVSSRRIINIDTRSQNSVNSQTKKDSLHINNNLKKLDELANTVNNFLPENRLLPNNFQKIFIEKNPNDLNEALTNIKSNLESIRNDQEIDLEKYNKLKDISKDSIVKYILSEQNINYYKQYLKALAEEILTRKQGNIIILEKDSLLNKRYAVFFSDFYFKLKNISEKGKISMNDILYLENKVIKQMIEFKVLSDQNDIVFDEIIKHSKFILPLLKNKIVNDVKKEFDFEKIDVKKAVDVFEFISRLDELGKAETFDYVINLFREGNNELSKHLKEGKFKDIYTLFANAFKKYTLVNSQDQYIELDVVSFIDEFMKYYNKNDDSHFAFYMSIGLSQNTFFRNVAIPEHGDYIKEIGLASEKLGVKYRLRTFSRSTDYKNVIQNDVYLNKNSPFINEWYASLYGGGLLYSIANSSTYENFDYPHVGLGTGIRFYNALDFSINIGIPFIKEGTPFKDIFLGFGFDVPLSEYLTKKKNK